MDLKSLVNWLHNGPQLAPSLYDVVPDASMLQRTLPRAEVVPADEIAGTTRHPSNTTSDLLPLPSLRSKNFSQRWRGILEAQARLAFLPPVELVKVGSRYFVIDGHKRVAAARRIGGVVDAIVVELRPARPACLPCSGC